MLDSWNGYWDMQNGATSHTTAEVMAWLNKDFRGCVNSCKAEVKWPTYNLDLNPLLYFFWSYAMVHVRRRKSATINELKESVKDVARTVLEHTIQDVVANIRKRCKACVLPDGDCFKYFLKYVEKQF